MVESLILLYFVCCLRAVLVFTANDVFMQLSKLHTNIPYTLESTNFT